MIPFSLDENFTTTQSPCEKPEWKGDGMCDDINNVESCGWDGGDCCGDNVVTTYCTACKCLDPAFGTTTEKTSEAPSTCAKPDWKGDNFCDDENNVESCDWDGGDCCGDNVITTYCTACECLDPNFETTCEDIWPEKKCKKRASKGKCNKNKVKAKCQKTCGYCGKDEKAGRIVMEDGFFDEEDYLYEMDED